MKKICILIPAILCFSITPYLSDADLKSREYITALESGDFQTVYQAQSYLAPPYCYDYNPWHGVTFTKAINGRFVIPSYPFTYQDMTCLKVRQLYERAGIADMEKESKNEIDLIRRISDWANMQWGHMQPIPYPTWDAIEILDKAETGDAFWCTFKAALFVQACNAAGLTARILGINPRHKAAHTVTEVYINDFRKWMLVDPWLNCYFERDGIPLSALEYHRARENPSGIFLVFGRNGKGTEYWNYKTGKAATIPHAGKRIQIEQDENKGMINMYYDVRIILRNDHTEHPQSKENIYIDSYMIPYNARGGEWWDPQLHWVDEKTMPLITTWNSGDIDDFEWPLNEVKVDFVKTSPTGEPVVLKTTFSSITPNFSHYRLEIDGSYVPFDSSVYHWKLKRGTNSLKVTSVNAVGRSGFPSEFILEYDPDKVDFSRTVTAELKNSGMEEIHNDLRDKGIKPKEWGTITSNPLGVGDFTLDPKVKHSGKYALRTTPARDPKTGIEYAFIVRSANFEVNPATDVIFSIWLKASKDHTPVDIALLESTYKGLGTYVERIMVDREWKKYELKCRLHNEFTNAYVGFKVYTGTVWADDTGYVELK